MPLVKDERDRILALIEAGQISAGEAAQLMDALDSELPIAQQLARQPRERTIRIRARIRTAQRQQRSYIASLPLQLLKVSARLGNTLLPQLDAERCAEIIAAIEAGQSGRLLDIQDMEQNERLEVFLD